MKKISILSTLLAGMVVFSACTEDEIAPVAEPFGFEPDETVAAAIAITAQEYAQPIVITDQSVDSVEAFTIDLSATPELPAETTFEYTLSMSKTVDMADAITIPVDVQGDVAKVATANLDANVKTLYGKRPQANTFYTQLAALVKSADGRRIQLLSNVITATVTPQAMPIESAYYLIGDFPGWNATSASAYAFSHSDKDVYEDPIFTLTVTIPSAGSNWKVAPQSFIEDGNNWDVVLGNVAADQNTALEGELLANGGSMQFAEAGTYKITLNMEEYTYVTELIPETSTLLVIGQYCNAWDASVAQRLYAAGSDPNYTGWIVFGEGPFDQGWKISADANWTTSWGGESTEAEPATMTLTSDNGANITCYNAFGYQMSFNKETAVLSILKTVSKWGICGDATATGWNGPDAAMSLAMDATAPEGENAYLVITAELLGGKQFKFRANDDPNWAINFGDSGNGDGTLVADGGNITVPEDGTYMIKFFFNASTPYYTLTRQ